jgi:hypothetical protein
VSGRKGYFGGVGTGLFGEGFDGFWVSDRELL